MDGLQDTLTYKTTRGYLTPDEREFLFDIAKGCNTIINIGVEYGASVICFAEGSNEDTKIVAIDLIGGNSFEGKLSCDSIYLYEEDFESMPDNEIGLVDQWLNLHTGKVVLFVKGNSNNVEIETVADCIFIDGCHWGECIQKDIDKYSKLCNKWLIFHDYSDSPIHAGVKDALDNWNCDEFEKINQIDSIAVYQRVNT